jgi:hypothetical protein
MTIRKIKILVILIIFIVNVQSITTVLAYDPPHTFCIGPADPVYSRILYSSDSSYWTEGTIWMPQTVFFKAVDNNGNMASPTHNVIYGVDCPTVTFPVTYTWYFDNITTNGINVTHSFNSSGIYNISLFARGFLSSTAVDNASIYIDADGPFSPYPIYSNPPILTVSTTSDITIWWEEPDDNGGSDIKGYYYALNEQYDYQVTVNDTFTTNTIVNYNNLTNSNNRYFHVLAMDNAGNKGDTSHKGPFQTDVSPRQEDLNLSQLTVKVYNDLNGAVFSGYSCEFMLTLNSITGWSIDSIEWKTFGITTIKTPSQNPYKLSFYIPSTTEHKLESLEIGIHLTKSDNSVQGWHRSFTCINNSFTVLSTKVDKAYYVIYFARNDIFNSDYDGPITTAAIDSCNGLYAPKWFHHWIGNPPPDRVAYATRSYNDSIVGMYDTDSDIIWIFRGASLSGGETICLEGDTSNSLNILSLPQKPSHQYLGISPTYSVLYPAYNNHNPSGGLYPNQWVGMDYALYVLAHESEHRRLYQDWWHNKYIGSLDYDRDLIPDEIENKRGTAFNSPFSHNFNKTYRVSDYEELVGWNLKDWEPREHKFDWAYYGENSNPPYMGN